MGFNTTFVQQAEKLIPKLFEHEVTPHRLVNIISDEAAFQGWRVDTASAYKMLEEASFSKNESVIFDFADHLVGYVSFKVKFVGSPPDAPLKIKLTFGEMPCEIGEPFESYNGWLSNSWLQDEIISLDVLPAVVSLSRRYSFRYMKIEILGISSKYKAQFSDICCNTVTSADVSKVKSLAADLPENFKIMDHIAIKTLQDCMQTVYEDGPKRDRRLWVGDLRLQAQANYVTFADQDLVKRCLYLFAGMTLPDGAIGACLFEKPTPHVDDTWLFDYSMLYVACLYDYYEATQDIECLQDLWSVALEQLKLGVTRLDERGIIREDSNWRCFIDWQNELNKQASGQAVLLYTLKRGQQLAKILDDLSSLKWITDKIDYVSNATLQYLWDAEQGLFVSGPECQVSWASQVWMVLAEILPQQENIKVLERIGNVQDAIGMNTPYMYHHYIESLFLSGLADKAWDQLLMYWGGMMADGADTFWELYNPQDKKLSPYGSNLINSYCHAWSCTPTYFIRKYRQKY